MALPLQPSPMTVKAPVVIAIVCAASICAAQPAVDHYRAGLALMKKQDHAAAATEFAAAYKLDPDPRYMFNLALAQRLGGDCKAALESYRAYLATNPPEVNANNARIGIERCETTLATTAPPVVEDKKPPDPPVEQPRMEPARPEPVPEPVRPEPVRDAPKQQRDRVGTLLLVGGGASAVASLSLYLIARDAASSTHDPGSLSDFESNRDRARTMEIGAWITGGLAIGLVAGGVIRIVTRRNTDVAVTPAAGGGSVVIGGRF